MGQNEIWRINQFLFFIMSFSIILVIAKWSSEIIIPLLISIMIALILQPLMEWLQNKGIPRVYSVSLVITMLFSLLILFGIFVADEINDFVNHIGEIKIGLQEGLNRLDNHLKSIGLPIEQNQLSAFIKPNGLVKFLKSMLLEMGNQFSNTLLILFTSSLLILDATSFKKRIHLILQDNPKQKKDIEKVLENIHLYFIIMTKVSLITAFSAMALLWFFDIPYILLWGVITFFLNFIPVVGSIIASLPPMLLGLIEHSWSVALWIGLGYLLINNIVGNILQPAMMSRGLGLSTFSVFWSMVFWGWFFGPTGMILSVPLTMGVQFLLAQYKETRWIAFLLSDNKV